MSKPLVACPTCKGSRVGCVTGQFPCPCCKGKGKITQKRADALAFVRRDLTERLRERERNA